MVEEMAEKLKESGLGLNDKKFRQSSQTLQGGGCVETFCCKEN